MSKSAHRIALQRPRGMVAMTEKDAATFARNHPEVQSGDG